MRKEKFTNITISYMRRIGPYGSKNIELMESLKEHIKSKDLFNDQLVILGIALDDPNNTPPNQLRYDVGLITGEDGVEGLKTRKIDDGLYAIFEVEHTQEGVHSFWENIKELTANLNIDYQRPILERYTMRKIKNHMCEFCVPLIE
ncbi:DNA gyrase inhibitor GyrI [Breznakia sp. PF5-3]|uniref:GyrI-like domain-containing protein n=1 Tax=unclassified Breznakia TaxID=2623764 RepID=UPI002405477D|nr:MULTISPECIES: GyrI-like domain-containing protein [unclassified Breznakia]MDF9824443.1 DNA gyrase inhibitor GyrI [Breznakia sp. PM6-1]MDF9835274.1 DNA gyrase inhibitor GyrI [Breznakia sp. PF5-3]MDF9837398.1 DNA gyrase inhibitor GyrI [Breznakia sp. PFB2-8]MDF9859333.1 DNA gyrase inhibitor GyrI [Breznakia sp. PH5-24]